MERVDELTAEPIVGDHYWVPTVRARWRHYAARNWSVLGTFHEDADIVDFEPWHFHLDPRFFPPSLYRMLGRSIWHASYEIFGTPLMLHPTDKDEPGIPFTKVAPPEIVYRRRKCHRAMLRYIDRVPKWQKALECSVRQRVLSGPYRRCPHRGLPLASMPVRDSVVVCPLHGLCFHAETGEMVPRESLPVGYFQFPGDPT